MKKRKYEVTGPFQGRHIGERTKAIVLVETDGDFLVFHPNRKEACGSIEICDLNTYEDCLTSSKQNYINIFSQKQIDTLIENLSKISYSKARK